MGTGLSQQSAIAGGAGATALLAVCLLYVCCIFALELSADTDKQSPVMICSGFYTNLTEDDIDSIRTDHANQANHANHANQANHG